MKRKGVVARRRLKEAWSKVPTRRTGSRSGRTSEHEVTKSISVKGQGCKSGGCAMKADGLTPGGLCRVSEWGLRGL